MNSIEVEVEYESVTYRVTGEMVGYVPARITADPYYSSPEEGGYIEDMRVHLGGFDITEHLAEEVTIEIGNLAYGQALEDEQGRFDMAVDFEIDRRRGK